MKSFLKLFSAVLVLSFGLNAFAGRAHEVVKNKASSRVDSNVLDEIDPFDPNIEEKLQQLDEIYEQQTGLPSHVDEVVPNLDDMVFFKGPVSAQVVPSCYRDNCQVWAQVVKSTQTLYLYVNGTLQYTWKVSTGIVGRETPNFDTHPDGRIYDRYDSKTFPGGDYNGMGNMPYAVFISGGFAIHGTGQSNWKKLGTRASHGCVRIYPDNAYYFNRLVRQVGVRNVWITVQN